MKKPVKKVRKASRSKAKSADRTSFPMDWFQSGYTFKSVNPMENPVLWGCVDLKSSDIARLPIRHFKVQPGGGALKDPNSRVLKVLNKPNGYQTRNDFLRYLAVSLFIEGNAYALISFNGRQEIEKLTPINPHMVIPRVAEDGSVFYQLSLDRVEAGSVGTKVTSILVPDYLIFHHREICLKHPLVGVSPLMAAAASTSLGLQIIQSQDSIFRNQAKPSGVLTSPNTLSKEVVERLKESWQSYFQGVNSGKTAVLEEGLKFEPLSMKAVDAEVVKQMEMSSLDIARAFRVPMSMLGHIEKTAFRNSEVMVRQYLSTTLASHLSNLEERLSALFQLDPTKEYLRFDLTFLLQAEIDVRMEALARAVQGGVYSVNDARDIEGLPPVEGGEKVRLQSQMVPIDGSQPPAPIPVPPAPADGGKELFKLLEDWNPGHGLQ